MSANRACAPIPAVLAVIFLLGCGACSERAPEEPQASNAAGKGQVSGARVGDETAPHEATDMNGLIRKLGSINPTGEDWNAVATETDAQNRYFATVMVEAFPSSADRELTLCSGVLVAPRLVLTAGNCVCSRRKQAAPDVGQRTLIDSTSCATSATVATILYDPPTATDLGGYRKVKWAGGVRPHPSLKIVLDGQGNIVSSEADLAVIQIPGSALGTFPPVTLADVDLRANESLVMVSYEGWRGDDERRFRQNHVTKILDAGARALFDQPRRDVYKGDSGGPCLRETGRGMALAGIMNRSLGAEASFTSTFHYRDWIRQEIQRASGDSPSPH